MTLLNMTNTPEQAEPFMAFVQDDITSRVLRDIAGSKDWNINRIMDGGIELAIEMLKEIRTPELMILDLSNCDHPMDQINELAGICAPGVRLICLGTMNDVTLYRDLLVMGVEDYLLKPIDSETLKHAIERIEEREETTPVVEHEGDITSVVGALGGVGGSTVALNLAWDLAHNKNQSVALVDLDLHFGTLALSLDLETGKGFREALENPSRIDSLFLERAMVKVNEKFSILACETDLDITYSFDPEALGFLLERLRQKFDQIILDVPRHLWPKFGDVLCEQGRVTIVTDLTLAAMRDSLRLTRFTKKHMVEDNMILLGNRLGENKERELAQNEFEKGIDHQFDSVIPFEPKCFAQADSQAEPVMKIMPKSKAALALAKINQKLCEAEDTELQKGSFFKRILGLQ